LPPLISVPLATPPDRNCSPPLEITVLLAVPPLLTVWVAPKSSTVDTVTPLDNTICDRPEESTAPDTVLPDTTSKISVPPVESVSPLTVPPDTTISPPLSTVVPLAVPPSTYSTAPLETVVALAVPE